MAPTTQADGIEHASSSEALKHGKSGTARGHKALAPALLLLALQASSRLLTFVLNQAMIRISDPGVYGTAHIKLDVLLSLILFLSREGVRAAALRHPSDLPNSSSTRPPPRSIRVLHLAPVLAGLTLACAVSRCISFIDEAALQAQPMFAQTLHLYLASTVFELLAEPLYLHALSPYGGRDLILRVKAEGAASVTKAMVTLATCFSLSLDAFSLTPSARGLMSFGLGQLAYGLTVLVVFALTYFRRWGIGATLRLYDLRDAKSDLTGHGSSHPSSTPYRLAMTLALQTVVKFLATEADKIAVSRLGTLQDQGGYALGVNYASLPLRILFQPLEESARFQFSSTKTAQVEQPRKHIDVSEAPKRSTFGGSTGQINNSNASQAATSTSTSPNVAESQDHGTQASLSLLRSLLQLHSTLGLLLLCFLPPLSMPVIHFLSGPQWLSTSAARTLSCFSFFLPVAGFSGILEGLVQSVASEEQLKRYSRVILGSSLGFVLALYSLTRFTSLTIEESLVFASTISMLIRAFAGWRFAKRFFGSRPLTLGSLLPSKQTSLMAVTGAVVARRAASASLSGSAKLGLSTHMPVLVAAATFGLASLGSL